jgi:IS4 transposase
MVLGQVFKAFAKESPVCVMIRGAMERMLEPERLDEWFEAQAESQYTRDLLFSTVFDIVSKVVSGSYPSVHAAYQVSKEQIEVSLTSVYNKLNHIETGTSAGLVRYAAAEATAVIEELGGSQESMLPGYRVKLLDGNCIEASEHRIKELRKLREGPLPGKSLVVYDAALRMPIDVFPCEDGHAQERSLLGEVLPTVKASDVWIADRNFCTRRFLAGIADQDAFFIIRQHGNLPWEPIGKETQSGRVDTGKVYQQSIRIVDEDGKTWEFRRIRLVLKKETRDGDKEIYIITNLTEQQVSAKTIATLYRKRWTIETAFQELALHLHSEINSLGYPPAALFCFCVALVSYIILAVVKAAMSSVHGIETVDKKISGYYLADEIAYTYRGMIIAIPFENWSVFRRFSRKEFIKVLQQLSGNIILSRYRKHSRGPKKPVKKQKPNPKKTHVSTAKIIAKRKNG